jgi:quinol monooxygenase YgiN
MFITFIKLQSMAEKRKELHQTLKTLATLTRTEAGCVESYLYQQVGDETVFLLISAWQSRAELEDHLQSSRFSVLLGAKSLLSRSPEMAIHTVVESIGVRALNPNYSPTDR